MRKKINIQKGAVLGAILTTIVAGMLLSVVQVVVKPPLLLGERLLPGGGWIQIVLAALFGGGYICRCSTGNDEACGGDVSGCSSRSCSLVSYFWEFSWIVCF